jgi:hypothetical protein
MKKIETDYDRFEDLARGVLKVPHSEIKEKLDAEKRAKKRRKAKISSASREAGDKD